MFYNLKKLEAMLIIFVMQYPIILAYKGIYNFTSNVVSFFSILSVSEVTYTSLLCL